MAAVHSGQPCAHMHCNAARWYGIDATKSTRCMSRSLCRGPVGEPASTPLLKRERCRLGCAEHVGLARLRLVADCSMAVRRLSTAFKRSLIVSNC